MIQQINQQASITRLRDTFRFLHSVSNAISSSQSCRCVVGSCCHSSSSNSRTWGQPLSSSCRVQSVSSSSSSNIHTDASAAIGEANQLEPALYVVVSGWKQPGSGCCCVTALLPTCCPFLCCCLSPPHFIISTSSTTVHLSLFPSAVTLPQPHPHPTLMQPHPHPTLDP